MKKILALSLALVVSVGTLIGCSKDTVTTKDNTLVYNLTEDPKTLDPTLNTSSGASTAISAAFEGLTKLDKNDKAIPAGAESWEVSEDGTVYTINLRKTAKWSDGKEIVANDYLESWHRALDPKTGAEYAYMLYPIKGAEDINVNGAGVDTLGVKVIDDYTLEITLNAPVSYFPELLAFNTYYPTRSDVVSNSDWTLKPETYISNGPFKMETYNLKSEIKFVKNEHYWNAENVKLDNLDMKIITDDTSAFAAFKTGQVDVTEFIPTAEIQNVLASGEAERYAQIGTYFYTFNLSGNDKEVEALKDKRVRRALALAIDRPSIIENVTKAGQVPAAAFVPSTMTNPDGTVFSKEYYDVKGNIEEAKKLLAEAGYPEGKGLPTLNLMYNSEGAHGNIAQAIQAMWKEIGVNVELSNQEWKVFLTTRNNHQYEIARHGWIGDYNDPMTFLDMWVTGGGNNDVGYSNPAYDELINKARVETDLGLRNEYLQKAQDILMDEMIILPIYYNTKIVAKKDHVKGLKVSSLGNLYFDEVEIVK